MTPPSERRAWALALAALLALLGARHARAEDPAGDKIEIGRIDIRSLLDLSVEAVNRRPELASQAPAAVFVLTGQDLRTHGFRTLAEALGSVPGLFGYPGSFEQVGVRGVGVLGDFTTRLLVLVDGHPLANAMGGDLGRGFPVPLAAVERLEVIKGPAGAVYGPTAYLGVVNVVTASDAPGGELWAGGEAAQGAVPAGEAAATWRGRRDELEVLLSADAYRTRGLRWDFPDVPPAGAVVDGFDDGHALSAYLRARWRDLRLSGACGHASAGLPATVPSADQTDQGNSLDGLTCFAESTWQGRVGDAVTLHLRAAFDHFEKGATIAFPPPPAGLGHYRQAGHDQWTTAELRAEWRAQEALRLEAGGTAQLHQVLQHSWSDALPQAEVRLNRRLQTVNTWLQAEAQVAPTLTLSGGVTFFAHSLFGNQLTPRLAAVWQPGGSDTVKAIWSTGFRPPTFVEALLQDAILFLANPDLAAEKVSSLELLYEHRFSEVASVGASLFRNRYRDLIAFVVVPAPGLDHQPDPANPADFRQVAQNAGTMAVMGGEASFKLRWRDWLQGWGGLSVQRTNARQQANFPTATASLALSSRAAWAPLLLAVRGTIVSARDKARDRLLPGQRARVPAAATLAASAALDVPGVPGLQVELTVQNLLDAAAPSPADGNATPVSEVPTAPRTARADLRWRF